MGQPSQDIGIISSFVTPKYEQEDLSGTTVNYPMEITQMDPMQERTKHRKHNDVRHKEGQIHNNNLEINLEDIFPWLVRFNKIMCMAVGNKSYDVLDRLLLVYTQNVLKSIEECEKILCKASKLKNHVHTTLTFFYFYWKDIRKPGDDHKLYLNKMSVLLGIYINMELKHFKQDNNVSKITSKLLTMLWIYLDNSVEHILKVLLRIKSASKESTKICNPIFKRCLDNISTSKCVTDIAYVRYVLTFKIWQEMQVDDGEKKKVNEMTLKKLGRCIPEMQPDLLEYARETFLLLEDRSRETASLRNSTGAKTSTVQKRSKVFSKQNTKEIIFIDLTKEESSNEVYGKAKKRNKRKLEALQIRRKKCKPQNSGIQVEVVHSTQNPKSNSTDTASRYLPISDNQVSESTEYSAKNFNEQPEISNENCCKMCSNQDGIQHSQKQTIKRESVKKENYDAEGLYKDTFADLHKVDCILRNVACINKSSVYATDVVEQKLPRNVNECVSCYKRIHAKPFSCHNQTTDYTTESNKFICDKAIVNRTLSDLDECMNALNRIGQRIVSVCTDKQHTELSEDRSNECSVSTTIFGDQDAGLQIANTTRDFNSSITNKLHRILEICNKNEFLNIQEVRSLFDLSQSEVNCSCNSTLHKSQEQQERRTAVTSTATQFDDDFARHDDFKTVDILADVLNGDMCMENEQDVLEDTSLVSSISNDNPANVFNYLNDTNELNEMTNSVKCMKPLPERTLGTAGILNSLLDFDLINMDSTLDDFMYSNIQTVNPSVIKKNLGKDTYATNKHGDESESESAEQMLSFTSENVVNLLPKENGECSTNQNDPVDNSVDIVGFGLNSSKPKVFDLSALEDEETDVRNMPSSLCQSPLPINSDIVSSDMKDISSKYMSVSPIHDLSSDISIERSYMYTKEDAMKDFQSFNDLRNKLLTKTCTSKDMPVNLLTDCFTGEDCPSLSYNSISVSPVQFKECNWSLEQSLITPNPLFSTAVNLVYDADSAVLPCESERTIETSECSLYTENTNDQRKEDQSHTKTNSIQEMGLELGTSYSWKKQVIIDIGQEDSASLFERNHENASRGVQEVSNIVYELSSQCDGQRSKKKYVKVGKRRLSAENNSPIGTKYVPDVPGSVLMKPKVRWFIRSVNTQPPLSVKKQKLKRVTDLTFSREEASMKIRESKFLSLSEKGVISKNKSKHAIV